MEAKYILSEKGNKLLTLNNFKFAKAHEAKSGKIRWCCINRKCKSKLYTINNAITEMHINHNHEEDLTVNRQAISNILKRKALEDLIERPAKLIYKELRNINYEDNLSVEDVDCIRRNIYFARRSVLPALPKSRNEVFDALHTLQVKTHKDEDFLNVGLSLRSAKRITISMAWTVALVASVAAWFTVAHTLNPDYHKAAGLSLKRWNTTMGDRKNNSDLINNSARTKIMDLFLNKRLINTNMSDFSFNNSNNSSVNGSLALKRRLEMSTEFFLVSFSTTSSTTPGGHITKTACTGCSTTEGNQIASVFRNEVWVIPVLTLSALIMILISGFEIFVLCKAWRTTPSRRHLFLGQMLLLGLFSCAGLGAVIAASPTQLTCAIVRFGTGVAYAIVFASLLVKCVFLISLNGGVYLPAPYQGLLLLFAILIQVAIGVQWLLTNPPIVDNVVFESEITQPKHRLLVTAEDISKPIIVPLCRTPYVDMLLSLIYVLFLISFVTVLAVKSRSIRDNYREATYIGLSVGCSIPTWVVWIMSGFIVNERHRDACLAFGLIISAAIVFLVMFMPKGRQLAAMGKEGVYVEDREDRFSSLSRAGSGYSPSFFHFKPTKYGVGGNNGSHKHQHAVANLGGDTVLRAPPPSYTRLYHFYSSPPGYYPAPYPPGCILLRPDDGNVYTTLEPTLSSNPNVYFQRGSGVHPGMMY